MVIVVAIMTIVGGHLLSAYDGGPSERVLGVRI